MNRQRQLEERLNQLESILQDKDDLINELQSRLKKVNRVGFVSLDGKQHLCLFSFLLLLTCRISMKLNAEFTNFIAIN